MHIIIINKKIFDYYTKKIITLHINQSYKKSLINELKIEKNKADSVGETIDNNLLHSLDKIIKNNQMSNRRNFIL